MSPQVVSSTMGPVLELRGLTVAYVTEAGPLEVVRDVSLSIRPRESYGLVGESGSGKSTLALGALGYLPSNGRVLAGQSLLAGTDLLALDRSELRKVWGKRVGMVYQNPSAALNPSMTIGRQLEEAARQQAGLSRREARAYVLEVLAKVELADPVAVARRYPHQLSGGMLQRCVIAMALLGDPQLLVLDEPTTALDVTTQAVVLDLILKLRDEFDSAILYITHDFGVVARVCDRVGVLYAGEMMEEAPVGELYRRPRHPYSLALLGCVPDFDLSRSKRRLLTIPGSIPGPRALPEGCVFAPRCDFVQPPCELAQPPLMRISPRNLTACRRWPVVPSAEEVVASVGDLPERAGTQGRVLEARDLVKHYTVRRGRGLSRRKEALKAVDGVTFWINRGSTFGLVGESGSGKTTVLRVLAGLTPPTGGEIKLDSQRLAASVSARPSSVLRRLQMVFQNPDSSLNPRITVGRAIGRSLRLLGGVRRDEISARVEELLQAVNLPPDYAGRLPEELSGGEKQRVAIARAFASSPEVILCDEPISSMDVSVQGALMNLLMDLQAENQTSYLFVSHDLAAVQHLSDWIMVMYLGYAMEFGDADDVLNPPYHPYTETLISAIPVADPDAKQARIRLRGSIPSPVDVPTGCRFHTRCPRFLGRVCVEEEPPWRQGQGEHWVYCHIPLEELTQLQAEALLLADSRPGAAGGQPSGGAGEDEP